MFATAFTTVLFFFLLAATFAFAVATVVTRHIFRSAIYLMGTLTTSAAFYLMLGAEFLAGVQILVYVGGIVVLIVFAVMLTSSNELLEDRPSAGRKIFAYFAAAAFYGMTVYTVIRTKFHVPADKARVLDDTAAIGRKLLDRGSNGYVVPFEVISVLLLCVVIGAIVIARKTTKAAAE